MTFDTGLNALKAFQTGIDVTSHNIANASTPYYKKKEVVFAAIEIPNLNSQSSASFSGHGSKVAQIRKVSDPFINNIQQYVNGFNAGKSAFDSYFDTVKPLNHYIEGNTSAFNQLALDLKTSYDTFANNPTNIQAKNDFLNNLKTGIGMINDLQSLTSGIKGSNDVEINREVNQVNGYLRNMNDYNKTLLSGSGNDSVEGRNRIEGDGLNQFAGGSYTYNENGTIDVVLGGKHVLSSTNSYSQISYADATNIKDGKIGGINQANVKLNDFSEMLVDLKSGLESLYADFSSGAIPTQVNSTVDNVFSGFSGIVETPEKISFDMATRASYFESPLFDLSSDSNNVDLAEEAIKLQKYTTYYQAMLKVIATESENFKSLLNIIA